jgi:hypothetical protein
VLDDNQTVTTTAEHPFMVVGQGWTPVRELRKGDLLVRPDGSTIPIHSIDATGETATVHNFEVEGLHNYYVQAGDEWLLVHNANCGLAALPRGGVTLTQERLEHVVYRHWSTSDAPMAGKFAPGTSARSLRDMIDHVAQNGTIRPNTQGRPGRIFEHDFGQHIGTTAKGKLTSRLRVVTDDDSNVVTSFPY